MKHKHANLIKAWADGAIVEEYRPNLDQWVEPEPYPIWDARFLYRIKPEPLKEQEPQYLYVYNHITTGENYLSPTFGRETSAWTYMGKVRVEK
jgi:hypothetical protein